MPEPIGSEIARRYPDRMAAAAAGDRLTLDREPCPICNHPTGDCSLRDHVVAQRRRDVALPPGDEANLAGVSTAVSPEIQAMLDGWVVVTEEVLDSRPAPGGGPPLSVVAYAPGKRVSTAEAAEKGLPVRPATLADFEANRLAV